MTRTRFLREVAVIAGAMYDELVALAMIESDRVCEMTLVALRTAFEMTLVALRTAFEPQEPAAPALRAKPNRRKPTRVFIRETRPIVQRDIKPSQPIIQQPRIERVVRVAAHRAPELGMRHGRNEEPAIAHPTPQPIPSRRCVSCGDELPMPSYVGHCITCARQWCSTCHTKPMPNHCCGDVTAPQLPKMSGFEPVVRSTWALDEFVGGLRVVYGGAA